MSEIKTNWDLGKFYYKGIDDPDYINDKNNILNITKEFANKYKGKIQNFTKAYEMKEFFDDEEKLIFAIQKPNYYVFLLSSLDTQNQQVLKELAELDIININSNNEIIFVDQEFKSLGYDKLMSFANDQLLKPYKHAIVTKANNIKYILEEKQERVLNQKGLPISQLNSLYDEFQNSFIFEVTIDGEKKFITESEVRALRADKNEFVRKEAYRSLRSIYNSKQSQIVFGNLYNGIVKERISNIKIRGFQDIMEPRNISEDMETSTVNMLLESVRDAYPLFQRYIRLKKAFMKKDIFYNWDLQAPLGDISTEISFEDGLKLYMDAMEDFDKEFFDYSKDMFETGRIDLMPKEGKSGGAFACYTKGHPSFVLLNFTGKIGDVSTISHELGHAIHGYLSQIQPQSVYSTGLCLAETASIFNELLLSNYLKKTLKKEEKIQFLNQQLEDVFATIFRQVQYVSFEKIIHQKIFDGEGVSYKDFNKFWRQTQLEMSGNEIVYDVDAENESGWSMIPHIFHTPFYCYAYAFGNMLSFALYGAYQQKGKDFVPIYKEILSAGGSMSPKDLLMRYGFDITKKEFYDLGIKEIKKMLDEFESLL